MLHWNGFAGFEQNTILICVYWTIMQTVITSTQFQLVSFFHCESFSNVKHVPINDHCLELLDITSEDLFEKIYYFLPVSLPLSQYVCAWNMLKLQNEAILQSKSTKLKICPTRIQPMHPEPIHEILTWELVKILGLRIDQMTIFDGFWRFFNKKFWNYFQIVQYMIRTSNANTS